MNELLLQLAVAHGIKPENLKKWRQREYVPHKHRLPLVIAAAKIGKLLTESDFDFRAKPRRAAKRVRS